MRFFIVGAAFRCITLTSLLVFCAVCSLYSYWDEIKKTGFSIDLDVEIDPLHEKHEKERRNEDNKRSWEKSEKAKKKGKEDKLSKKDKEKSARYIFENMV